ncbi:MAG: hypothetical protein J1E28_02670, partial [Helicobacter sp.]|uniref:hypothetical protein n=1 Tax=Helicobacter sp. TaxID=218 RepID=UPI0025C53E82
MKTLLERLEQQFGSIQNITHLALSYDASLLAMLLQDNKAKEQFFAPIFAPPPPINNRLKVESSQECQEQSALPLFKEKFEAF